MHHASNLPSGSLKSTASPTIWYERLAAFTPLAISASLYSFGRQPELILGVLPYSASNPFTAGINFCALVSTSGGSLYCFSWPW